VALLLRESLPLFDLYPANPASLCHWAMPLMWFCIARMCMNLLVPLALSVTRSLDTALILHEAPSLPEAPHPLLRSSWYGCPLHSMHDPSFGPWTCKSSCSYPTSRWDRTCNATCRILLWVKECLVAQAWCTWMGRLLFERRQRQRPQHARYHVELPGQISGRSNSIVFLNKELENIKKWHLIS
jgi:hypothetical protein